MFQEGKIGSTRRDLDTWIRMMPQPRTIAMEATIFTGWIYDYLLPHAEKVNRLLKERLRRLRTVPGVGPITALTWALEIGHYTRFTSTKQAISYCGLCGDEKSSADKVLRMPISKQRNSTSKGC